MWEQCQPHSSTTANYNNIRLLPNPSDMHVFLQKILPFDRNAISTKADNVYEARIARLCLSIDTIQGRYLGGSHQMFLPFYIIQFSSFPIPHPKNLEGRTGFDTGELSFQVPHPVRSYELLDENITDGTQLGLVIQHLL